MLDNWGLILLFSSFTSSLTLHYQSYLIVKSKKSNQISVAHFAFTLSNLYVHLAYSIHLQNTNMIIPFSHSCFSMTLFLSICVYYRYIDYTVIRYKTCNGEQELNSFA